MSPPAPTQSVIPTVNPTPSASSVTPSPDPAAQQLAGMTAQEKVGQLLIAGIYGTLAGADAADAIEGKQVGGIILFRRNVDSAEQVGALNNSLKALNEGGIPLLLCVDEEGGRVSRMPDEVSELPSALSCGQSAGGAQCYELGQVLASACTTLGFNVDFAPVLDVWTNPDNTVIGDRAFAGEAATVTALGTALMQGLADGGVIPVVKHFPGHGDTAMDSHVGLPTVDKSLEELWQTELLPFQAAVESGAPAVMVGHMLMTQIDPDLPASLSPAMVDGLLRGELGFEGVVFTDDLTMSAISQSYGMGEAAVLAVEAGCDMLLVCHKGENLDAAYAALLDAVHSGRISPERLDESVLRILSLKEDYALSDGPTPTPDVAKLNGKIADLVDKVTNIYP